MHSISILDKDYSHWVKNLSSRYRKSQLKAAIKVNYEMLRFYWSLGEDIVTMKAESRWGDKFLQSLSKDLKAQNPDATCFSETNLLYMKNFYLLYQPLLKDLPKDKQQITNNKIAQQVVEQLDDVKITQQAAEQLRNDIFKIPWGHHMVIIDKFLHKDPTKALYYVRETINNGWSRSSLLNWIKSGVENRQAKALNNFINTLPELTSDLAKEITKDPYDFAFTGITGRYNERMLKEALLSNITNFLIELGTGFAYVGKEYKLQIGGTDNFIDLLFYNLHLSCYVVIEVKIGKFAFADAGQLGGYVVACNHILRKEGRDNPTIGLLICKEKDKVQAQYALEASTQPIAISEYELEKFYPEKVEGTMPSIEEIEEKLSKE